MGFTKRPKEEPKQKEVVETPQSETDKFKILFSLGKQLDKDHQTTNSLVRLGSRVGAQVPHVSTNLPSVDYDLFQCGGVPLGRIIEIFGPESAGKTTVALHIIAAFQKAGHLAAFVDAEHALDPTYAHHLGVDVDKLVINQPNSGEQALEVTQKLIESKCVGIIVVDSVAALVPEAELAGEMSDANVGLHARLMSKAMRKLTGIADANQVTLVFINQIREKIGVMFGNPETTTGGRALKFYSSTRIDVRRRDVIGEKTSPIGHTLELKFVKNKVGAPFRSAELDLYYPGCSDLVGLDTDGDLAVYASKKGIFEQNGVWFQTAGENVANGLKGLKTAIRDNDQIVTGYTTEKDEKTGKDKKMTVVEPIKTFLFRRIEEIRAEESKKALSKESI